MAEERTDCICITVIKRIWTLVKRPFISMVKSSQDNQVIAVMDASASLSSAASSSSSEMRASCVAAGPVTSSSAAVERKYDVYLSFGGPDTRKGVIFEIYDQLQTRGIKTFMDDREFEVGDPVPPTLIEAIRESRFAVVVFSRDYASSTWCLEELTAICECMKDENRILPLLYHVQPSDVRLGKRRFNAAFSVLETSSGSEKMQRWSEALEKVANYVRWNTQDYKTHKQLVEAIVEFLHSKVLPDAMGSKEDFEGYEEPIQAMDEEMKELTIESSASQWKHDVFLSFRGPDARKGIASYLFYELQCRGIRTFMDEEGLKAGNHISSNLLTAIKESRSAIVILSPKYASSAWCLDELANIVQGWENRKTLIFPVFYNVEPHDVRHQIGSFEELFTGHGKQRHGKKVLNQWKAALTTVANLTGFESKIYRSDRHLVEEIVQYVFSQVRNLEIESPGSKFKATKKALGKVVEALIEDEIAASSVLGGIISNETLAFISQAITLLPYYFNI
ncbi:hypothetical protein ACLB2K_044523 [Fragaria x ananassa]